MDDLNLLLELSTLENVAEAWKIVGEWQFVIETNNGPRKVRIKVLMDENGRYMAYPDIYIDGYIPIHLYDSVEEAVKVTLALVIGNLMKKSNPVIKPYEDY
ncbi:MAG: hypothetical protein H0Z18_08110 [Thermococcus sp.]|uniref:hypothetical protein n=1 Tax=Thermococcus sp. TaxID=35749 RepID=UPI001D70450F|nr:hypothetical protein [Thermococcus sp.]MBO8175207.1 hypothetical protein [Thermococcus sp.]